MEYTPTSIWKEREPGERANDLHRTVPDELRKRFTGNAWEPLPGSKPVPLMERTGCAWSVSDGSTHLFCNEPTADGPYCPTHKRRAYSQREKAA